jgi:hypothetical protein
VDHLAIGVEKFNKESVTRDLKERGVIPEDPEGISVQIVGA